MMPAVKSERGMIEPIVVASDRQKDQPQRTTSSTGTAQRYAPPPRQMGFFEALFGGGNQRLVPPNRIR